MERNGGRPKKITSGFENTKTKTKPNVNDNVNENVNVNANENVNVSDSCVDGLQLTNMNDSCVDGSKQANDSCVDDLQDIIAFYNNNIGLITPYQLEVLSDYSKDMEINLIILAMKKAVEANKRTIQYVKGILNNWLKKGITTVLEAEKEDEEYRNKSLVKEETEEEKTARKIKELEESIKNGSS